MRIDVIRCDRCGFDKPNPSIHILPAVIKLRRTGGQEAALDVTADWCEPCFDAVLRGVAAVMGAK